LEGDARNWFCDFPYNSFDSLQAIVNAFKNRYGDQMDSPSANYNEKKGESDFVKGLTILEKFQEDTPRQSLPYCRRCESLHDEATCVVARRILDSGRAGTKDQINTMMISILSRNLLKLLKTCNLVKHSR